MKIEMKIPAEFPQFEDKKVLIVATGAQDADIYLASNGILDKVVYFRIPRRRYSDKEGFFSSRTKIGKRGMGIASGADREYPKEAAIQDFLNRLEAELKTTSKKEKISYVCLFSPDYMMKMVKSVFPADLRDKVKISITGNFSQHRPIELLEKINLKVKRLI